MWYKCFLGDLNPSYKGCPKCFKQEVNLGLNSKWPPKAVDTKENKVGSFLSLCKATLGRKALYTFELIDWLGPFLTHNIEWHTNKT